MSSDEFRSAGRDTVDFLAGYLDGFDLSRQDAEALIMSARIHAGWIEAPAEAPEAEAGEEAEA